MSILSNKLEHVCLNSNNIASCTTYGLTKKHYVTFNNLQIKFIVDGHWKVDPQRESAIKGGLENNILRVER